MPVADRPSLDAWFQTLLSPCAGDPPADMVAASDSVVAGHTTTSLIGNSVFALLDHPDHMAALVADPGLLPGAVEELLRFCAEVPHATFRVTTEAVDFGYMVIPGGKQVLVCLAAANYGPLEWDVGLLV